VAHADDWRIDDNENFITLSKNGEIQHGNNIYFSFHKQNRCLFDVFFFIYTMQDIQNPLIEIYEDQNIDLIFGGSPIPALLNYSSEFALGQLVGIYVAREVPLSQQFIDMTEDMLQDNFMKMEITGKHLQYFDMPDEQWDFTNIETHLNKAHSRCVSQLLLSQ
tara:strand:+ start:3616 stop:4104 length:489 start_codon:yes stop_codon:yes gene_type:complete